MFEWISRYLKLCMVISGRRGELMTDEAMNVAGRVVERQLELNRPVSKLQLQKLLYLIEVASREIWAKRAFRQPVIALPYGPAVSVVVNRYEPAASAPDHLIKAPIGPTSVSDETEFVIDWVLERFGTWSANQLIHYVKRPGNPWDKTRKEHGSGPNSVINDVASHVWFQEMGGLSPTQPPLPPGAEDATTLEDLLKLI